MNAPTKTKIIVVVGATASGKSSLAIDLAQKFSGEVISADSRQVYRGLDIGTAKVTPDEMAGVPHHLLDVATPDQVYTAADFKRDATEAIAGIINRGHLPIIAGGTFFYIDILLNRMSMPAVPPNPDLREKLEQQTTAELFEILQARDPNRAATIDQANRRRLIRALEVIETLSTHPPTELLDAPYEVLWLGIERTKEDLRQRYQKRAEEWLNGSFGTEVKQLLANSVTRERLEEIGFEYRLMLDYLDGKLTDEAFIARAIEKNWQYAKRQLTWLKKNYEIKWFTPEETEQLTETVTTFLNF
jgi:tRNA dimethylallyltransferase